MRGAKGAWIEGQRGAYVVRWRDGTRNAAGRLIKWKHPETFVKRELALEEMRNRQDDLMIKRRSRKRASAAPMAIRELLERFISERQRLRKLADSTAAEYREAIKRLVEATSWKSVTDLSRAAIRTYQSATGGRGCSRPFAYLRSVLTWAVRELDQPVDRVTIDALSIATISARDQADLPPKELYTAEQLGACFVRCDTYGLDLSALARYLAKYGARPRTAARLLVGDYVKEAGVGTLTLRRLKNGRTITHPLDEATVAMFDRLVQGRDAAQPLFRDMHGAAWPLDHRGKPDTMCKWWSRAIAYDLPASLRGIYDLKRYAITTMLRNGIDLATIALFTGHKDVRSLLRYCRTNQIIAQGALGKLPSTGMYVPPSAQEAG
jgi:hypothetical protein